MSDKFDYLDGEQKKVWERIVAVEDKLKKRTPEYEADARNSSKMASQYKNKCEDTKNEAQRYLTEIQDAKSSVDSLLASITAAHEEAQKTSESVVVASDACNEIAARKAGLEADILELEEIFSSRDNLSDRLETLDRLHDKSEESLSKINASLAAIESRKKDLDTLYYQIMGSKRTDPETGEEHENPGLKSELEDAYSELKNGFRNFTYDKRQEIDAMLETWRQAHESSLNKINSLLPRALTAGLSYAYTQKKDDELRTLAEMDATFRRYIKWLVAISMIPFAVGIYQVISGVTLEAAILQMPRLVLSIFPLYIPVLWVAYSSSKKINLSKRLIEEYTHKEVLSKTFEGLANQIQDIDDKGVSTDLRARLLYNILEISSENPGKLISDYNKSDHPFFDALDKSAKLSSAVDKLSKIPGANRLSFLLKEKSDAVLDSANKQVQAGLNKIDRSSSG